MPPTRFSRAAPDFAILKSRAKISNNFRDRVFS
jgi:hypothetical protein